MARTVKVNLDVDEKPYVRGVERAEKATERLDDAVDDLGGSAKDTTASVGKASDAVDDLGGSARDTGRQLDGLRRDADRLDRQIDETTRGIRDLAREIARTSDEAERAKLTEKLTGQRRGLRDLTDLRKLIDVPDPGQSGVKFGARFAEGIAQGLARAGGPIANALSSVFGGIPPQAQAAIGAGLVSAVIAAAPIILSAISGAVVGAAGTGGVIGGFALAARDPRVKAEAQALGQFALGTLQDAFGDFIPETIDALRDGRKAIRSWLPELDRIGDEAADLVDPLVDGLLGFVDNALPGLRKLIEEADPFFEMLSRELPELGTDVGELFGTMAEHSEEGAEAMGLILDLLGAQLDLWKNITAVSGVYFGFLSKFSLLRFFVDDDDAQAIENVAGAVEDAGGKVDVTAGHVRDLRDELSDAARFAKLLQDRFDELFGSELDLDRATLEYKEGLTDLKEELRDGARTLNINSQEGRDNASAVLDQIERIKELRDARIEHGMSLDEANGKYKTDIQGLRDTLTQLGFNAGAVEELIGKYEDIPGTVSTTVTLKDEATGELIGFEKRIKRLDGTVITIRTRLTSEGEVIPGFGTQVANRWGGVYTHARDGVLRQAQVFSPVSPARYAFAEPATGGEAFIPRNGDPGQSVDILRQAGAWYGQAVVPMHGAGVSVSPAFDVRVFVGDRELTDIVDVRISDRDRALKSRVMAGAGRRR